MTEDQHTSDLLKNYFDYNAQYNKYVLVQLAVFSQLKTHWWLYSFVCQEEEDKNILVSLLKAQEYNLSSNEMKIIMLLSMTQKGSQKTLLHFYQMTDLILIFDYLLGSLGYKENKNIS